MGRSIGNHEYRSTLTSFDLKVRRKSTEKIQKLPKDSAKSHENMTSDFQRVKQNELDNFSVLGNPLTALTNEVFVLGEQYFEGER